MSFMTRMGTVAAAALMVAAGAADAEEWNISLGDGAGSAQEHLAQSFVEELENATGGEHTGTLFLNGQLGSEQDTINDAAMGLLDFSVVAINNITPFSPSVGTLTLPYVILSLEDAETITQGPIGEELTENTVRDAGVRILGWSYTGFRRLTNSERPVETLDDLQGLVIRVPKNEIMIDTYNAWGVNPTPMAWSETFAALQQGVVDGQDNPYLTINAMKFDEVQDYVTNLRYVFSLEPLVISESTFQGPVGGGAAGDDRRRRGRDRVLRAVPPRQGGGDQGGALGEGHGDHRSGQRRAGVHRARHLRGLA